MEKDKQTNVGEEFWKETEANEAAETAKGFDGDTGEYVTEPVENEDEDDGLDEKLGLNRHPHVENEIDEESKEEWLTNCDGESFKGYELILPKNKKLEIEIYVLEKDGKFYASHNMMHGTYGESSYPSSKQCTPHDTPEDAINTEINKLANRHEGIREILKNTDYGDILKDETQEPTPEKVNEVKCPNIRCTFHLPFEEGAKCVSCGFTFNKKNMEEFQEKDLHEEGNAEFIEGIVEKPVKLTPAQRDKKIAGLEEDIAKAKVRMSEIEEIAELSKNNGFTKLLLEIKGAVHTEVDREDLKDTKDAGKGLKNIDAVLLTERLVMNFNSVFNSKKADIKSWENQIIELKAGQIGLFDNAQEAEEKSDSIVMDNVINDEVESFATAKSA